MRLILALGAAIAVTTVATAYAQSEERSERTHVFIRHGGHGQMDADNDGWISRAESAAAADRIFGELDRNDDGRLTDDDRPEIHTFELELDHPHHAPEAADDDNCTRTESVEGDERRVTIVCRTERVEHSEDGEERREVRRHVVRRGEGGDVMIRRHGGDGHGEPMVAPLPPHPPMAPHAPMFMMFLGDESEADLNNDDAISQDEFRAQHLRMFDAHDANGDGRVRAHRMPEPPEAPVPPTPPSPPRRG